MTQRTLIITGASDGIGAAAAKALHERGDRVILVGRSPEKTAKVAESLGCDHFVADFSKLDEVATLADTLLEHCEAIDVLANNAGGIMGDRKLSDDGHELTFQVNHLAPFLLTKLLLPRLLDSKATVINTASAANKLFAKFDIDDLEGEQHYSANRAYGNAKLENILFTAELHRRHHDDGLSTAAFHPGVVATSFSAGSSTAMRFLYQSVLKRLLLSPEQGADTLIWLATAAPELEWPSGAYFEKRRISKANPIAYDVDIAEELWDHSEAMLEPWLG